jgi:hypothetical protein
MKIPVRRMDALILAKEFPIKDRLANWYFRCEEVSAGVYRAEGTDVWGRRVEASATDPSVALERCVEGAARIVRDLSSASPDVAV